MKRTMLLLLGLILIFILTYLCFLSKSEIIKKDLLDKAHNVYSNTPMKNINVALKGDSIKMTRELILTGSIASEDEKRKAESLVENIKGVSRVNNQLTIIEKKEQPIKEKKEITPLASPYIISSISSKKNEIIFIGYLPSKDAHKEVIKKAKEIFNDKIFIDRFKIATGAPKKWREITELGFRVLNKVEYGQFKISDNSFNFEGYVKSKKLKEQLVKELTEGKPQNYEGTYQIDTPKKISIPKPLMPIQESNETNESSKTTVENKNSVLNISSSTPPALSCQEKFKKLLEEHKIHFSYNKSKIQLSSYPTLDSIVSITKSCPNSHIIIEGHTDSDGERAYNKWLSQKRANAVKRYLISKGVEKSRLKAIGYGESRPLVPNISREAKRKNRRIELKIEGEK